VLRFIVSFFGAIFSMVTLGLLFAALTVGGIFSIYGRDLPSHESLAQYAPPTISRIYSAEGKLMDEFATERRLFVPISDIPALVKDAFISAEDKHFYTHAGYDVQGMMAAALEAIKTRGQTKRGASTITQQVTKNFLLSGDKTVARKIKEIILATRLEQTLSKDRILELYLNEIFLGQNSYGVAAAAQTYFNKTLEELTPAEAATLASFPKAPSEFHPVRAKDRLVERRNYVLNEMVQNGYLDPALGKSAAAEPLRTVQGGDIPTFRTDMPPRDYFTDEIRRQLSGTFGENEFFSGGLSIRATEDPQMQKIAAKALREGLEKYDRDQGVWRGTGKTLPAEALTPDTWRAALADVAGLPRDVEGWRAAVVLSVDDTTATVGIEGEDETAQIPAKDVTWAKKRLADGTLGRKAKVPADLVAIGDIVMVRPVLADDGSRDHLSLIHI
jgi:penicillin-binding protein 1A